MVEFKEKPENHQSNRQVSSSGDHERQYQIAWQFIQLLPSLSLQYAAGVAKKAKSKEILALVWARCAMGHQLHPGKLL